MASFILFSDSTTAQTLTTGEYGFIGKGASLAVDGDAITSTGDVLVSVYGLLSSTLNAVDHGDGAFLLNVGAGGRVEGNGGDAVFADAVDGSSITNDGRIVSSFDAIDVSGTGLISVVNNGTLVGESDGLATATVGGFVRIVNNGVIDGFDGGINHFGGESLLINRGEIREGESYGFRGEGQRDEVRNSGSIGGGVFMEAGDDFVFNRGVIDFVNLGVGDDVYMAGRDGIAERVDGRDGEDALVGGRSDDFFIGGTGPDTFAYARRGGDDRIDDFGGRDRIDLTSFGFARFAEVRNRIEDRPNGSLIDLSDDGLTIFLEGVDKADLRASDFLLFQIL